MSKKASIVLWHSNNEEKFWNRGPLFGSFHNRNDLGFLQCYSWMSFLNWWRSDSSWMVVTLGLWFSSKYFTNTVQFFVHVPKIWWDLSSDLASLASWAFFAVRCSFTKTSLCLSARRLSAAAFITRVFVLRLRNRITIRGGFDLSFVLRVWHTDISELEIGILTLSINWMTWDSRSCCSLFGAFSWVSLEIAPVAALAYFCVGA